MLDTFRPARSFHPRFIRYGNTALILPTFCQDDGRTALICAASRGHLEVARTLLQAGASFRKQIRNKDGAAQVSCGPYTHWWLLTDDQGRAAKPPVMAYAVVRFLYWILGRLALLQCCHVVLVRDDNYLQLAVVAWRLQQLVDTFC